MIIIFMGTKVKCTLMRGRGWDEARIIVSSDIYSPEMKLIACLILAWYYSPDNTHSPSLSLPPSLSPSLPLPSLPLPPLSLSSLSPPSSGQRDQALDWKTAPPVFILSYLILGSEKDAHCKEVGVVSCDTQLALHFVPSFVSLSPTSPPFHPPLSLLFSLPLSFLPLFFLSGAGGVWSQIYIKCDCKLSQLF